MKEDKFIIKYYDSYHGVKWKTFSTEQKAKNFLMTIRPSKNIRLYELNRVVKYKLSVSFETKGKK